MVREYVCVCPTKVAIKKPTVSVSDAPCPKLGPLRPPPSIRAYFGKVASSSQIIPRPEFILHPPAGEGLGPKQEIRIGEPRQVEVRGSTDS